MSERMSVLSRSALRWQIPAHASGSPLTRTDAAAVLLLTSAMFALRHLFRGDVYFVDGPRLVTCIQRGIFTVQSPGYWVFAHLGGLFRNPAAGLAFWNQFFSSLGIGAFFLLCRTFRLERWIALLAATAYGSVYYVWFAAEIHSAYAAETLFPVLALFCVREMQRTHIAAWGIASGLAAGAATALRPPDGVFLFPLWCFLLLFSGLRLRAVLLFAATLVASFVAWYIPSTRALHAAGYPSADSQVWIFARITSPLVVGLTPRALANMSRVVLPLLAAFWMFLPSLLLKRLAWVNAVAALWVLPGLAFYLLVYMADPTYLVYLTGGIVLAATLSLPRNWAVSSLFICCLWNSGIFLAAQPQHSSNTVSRVWTFYVAKYSSHGIRQHWTETLGQKGRNVL